MDMIWSSDKTKDHNLDVSAAVSRYTAPQALSCQGQTAVHAIADVLLMP